MLPTKKSSAPNPKEGAGPKVLPTKKSTAPNPKEVAGLREDDGVVVLWRVLMVVVFLEKVKEKVEALVELLELWWFIWRWRRKKMKVGS